MKCCDFCKKLKKLSEFNKDKTCKDGLDRKCRLCRSKYKKRYRSNPVVKKKEKEYRKSYKMEDRLKRRIFRQHRSVFIKINRIKKSLEKLIVSCDKLLSLYSYERRCSSCKELRLKTEMVSHGRRNAQSIVGYRCIYCSKAKSAKRRSEKFGITETFNGIDVASVFERFLHSCFFCGSQSNICIDHHWPRRYMKPLSHSNAVILCGSCNSTKGTNSPVSFYSIDQRKTLEKSYGIES